LQNCFAMNYDHFERQVKKAKTKFKIKSNLKAKSHAKHLTKLINTTIEP
jgi:hypothetical protein